MDFDLGVFLIFLGFWIPAILSAGFISFFTTFLRNAWIRLLVRAALVSIAIAPSEDHHGVCFFATLAIASNLRLCSRRKIFSVSLDPNEPITLPGHTDLH